MKSLDRFKLKMNLAGGSMRNEHVISGIKLLEETFDEDASFANGIYLWEVGKKSYEGDKPIKIRIYKQTFSNANGVTMSFQVLNDTPVQIGDVLYDSRTDEYLLCTEVFNIGDVHFQGKLTLCNLILRWQNLDGDILDYPCHDMNATQYNSGEQSNKQFTIGSSQHLLILPYDENTVMLNTPQRFFLDRNIVRPTSFIVTQNDTTSYRYGKKGLVRVSVLECATNSSTDRIDLGICDYFEKDPGSNADNDVAGTSKSVISYNTLIIKSGGDSQRFKAEFFDESGNKLEGIKPLWNIICGFVNSLDIEYDGNDILIGIDDDRFVDEEFKLVLSDEHGGYQSSIVIRVESLI